jgi:hypothetical protein
MAADILIKTQTFPPGFVNVAYEAGVATTGNATAITAHSIATGALPPGLTVNASDHLRIAGIPTASGKFTFTIALTDTAGVTTSPSLSIVIVSPGKSPLTDGNFPVADQLKVQWPSEF